jgi:hypothetical protein
MTLVETVVPGTASSVRVPEDWRVTADPEIGLLAVEDVTGRFASSLTTVLDPTQRALSDAPAQAAMAMLVAPALLDGAVGEGRADVLLCHLAGGISATARQRQVVVAEGLLVLTFTAATSRWAELADLADEVLDSLEPAA